MLGLNYESLDTVYSIEYYAGWAKYDLFNCPTCGKSGNKVTDTNKNFNLYLPSLVGYTVVIFDTMSMGNQNYAKGTVISNTATSFTVDGWTALQNPGGGIPSGGIPADGTINYYFSATGQTMMCSDCHSTDAISSTAAQGPHGSAVKWMLKGRNRAWPTLAASENGTGTGTLRTIGNRPVPSHRSVNDGTADGLFCLNCHSTASFSKNLYGVQDSSNIHLIHARWAGPTCVNCHIMVPHGGAQSRFIGINSMPARYAFNNDLSNAKLTYFKMKTFEPSHTGEPGDPASYGPSASQWCNGVSGCHYVP